MVGGIENEGESMPRTRKNHPPSLKAKVAIEAIKAQTTTTQIAQMFGVHPTQVGGWKRQALAGLPDVFGNGREQIRHQARRGERRTLQADRSVESGVGLSQKKSRTYHLKDAAYGSIRDIPI